MFKMRGQRIGRNGRMKTIIDYQFMPQGADRPLDNGEVIGIDASSEKGTVIIPNVGDFVQIDSSPIEAKHNSFSGEVRSRLFRYVVTSDEIFCQVNIVVAESENYKAGELIKE